MCTNVEISNIVATNEEAKAKVKTNACRRRRTTFHDLRIDNVVYMRKKRQNKLMSTYDPLPYIVQGIKGSMLTAWRGD